MLHPHSSYAQWIKGRRHEWKNALRAPLHPHTHKGFWTEKTAKFTPSSGSCQYRPAQELFMSTFLTEISKWKEIFYVVFTGLQMTLSGLQFILQSHMHTIKIWSSFLHLLDVSIEFGTNTYHNKYFIFKFDGWGHWFSVRFKLFNYHRFNCQRANAQSAVTDLGCLAF